MPRVYFTKPEAEQRKKHVSVMLTEKEYKKLQNFAEQLGLTSSTYARMVLIKNFEATHA